MGFGQVLDGGSNVGKTCIEFCIALEVAEQGLLSLGRRSLIGRMWKPLHDRKNRAVEIWEDVQNHAATRCDVEFEPGMSNFSYGDLAFGEAAFDVFDPDADPVDNLESKDVSIGPYENVARWDVLQGFTLHDNFEL